MIADPLRHVTIICIKQILSMVILTYTSTSSISYIGYGISQVESAQFCYSILQDFKQTEIGTPDCDCVHVIYSIHAYMSKHT